MDHLTVLPTSCGPHGFIEEDLFFPIISLWELYVTMATRVPIQ